MAQESCNLDKDEAEILKPSSPSSNPSPSQPAAAAAISNSSSSSLPAAATPASLCLKTVQVISVQKPAKPGASPVAFSKPKAEKGSHHPPAQVGNRCCSCRTKVGLTGFRCRCGDLFCAQHRYSDTHDCTFDYKALGREEIAKANPVIRAAKIIKI